MKWNKKKLIDGYHAFYKVSAISPTVDMMEEIIIQVEIKLKKSKRLYWYISDPKPFT